MTGSADSTSSSTGGAGGSGTAGFVSVRAFGATTIPADSVFSVALPKDTFKHADAKASVVLEARMDSGQPMPDWLSFDAGSGRFSGRAPQGVQELQICVIARDSTGGEAAAKIVLRFNGASEVK
jgi:hypothetical protein